MGNVDLKCLKDKIIENSEVYLRILRKEDIDLFLKITKDKMLWTFFSYDLSDKRKLEEWVGNALVEFGKNKRIPFAIIDKSTGKIVGSTSIINNSEKGDSVEIASTWLGMEFQGKGFSQVTKKLIINCCFDNNIDQIDFKVDVRNIAAKRSLEKIDNVKEYRASNQSDNYLYYCISKKG